MFHEILHLIFQLLQWYIPALRAGSGETGRALKIASSGYFQQNAAATALMIFAEAAVQRTALLFRKGGRNPVWRKDMFSPVPVAFLCSFPDQRFKSSVFRTFFYQIDPVFSYCFLGRQDFQAYRADALSFFLHINFLVFHPGLHPVLFLFPVFCCIIDLHNLFLQDSLDLQSPLLCRKNRAAEPMVFFYFKPLQPCSQLLSGNRKFIFIRSGFCKTVFCLFPFKFHL